MPGKIVCETAGADAFILTDLFRGPSVPETERGRLWRQRVAMGVYSDILGERIAAFGTRRSDPTDWSAA